MSDQPRVLISYSHESADHMNEVLALSDRLRADGIDCVIDQYETFPSKGWPNWMLEQVEAADFILMVCTETYHRRATGSREEDSGHGVAYEAGMIRQVLFEAKGDNKKFLPIILKPEDRNYMPVDLRQFNYFDLSTDGGYDALYRLLTDQPRTRKPNIGQKRLVAAVYSSSVPESSAHYESSSGYGHKNTPAVLDSPNVPSTASTLVSVTPDVALPRAPMTPSNLPEQITSFIGREKELAVIRHLLGKERLITLTGDGGCGKTRLALQAASSMSEQFPDGVWLSEIAPISDPLHVEQAVAGTVGVRADSGRSLEQTLVDYLRHRTVLLVLDNCEHVLPACAQLADSVLRACRNVRILATSREALGVPGERIYRITPLCLPSAKQPQTAQSVRQYAAAQLFIERAVSAQAEFTVTDQNAPAVARLCCRLDGIPLAIELAAARVLVMPVETILSRLDDRFGFLKSGPRTALPHHKTLRAMIDWSYDLLSAAERVMVRRLSVFSGGWTIEAAEAVCSHGVEKWEVLDQLMSLVEKSLVIFDEHGSEARYRLLETVRQYSRDRLAEGGEEESLRRRHRDYFLKFVEEARPRLINADQAVWLNRLEVDQDNIRAALEWSLRGDPEAEAGLRIAYALWTYWGARGNATESLQWMEGLLEKSRNAPSKWRARVLCETGTFIRNSGDTDRARPLLEESAALAREVGDKDGLGMALMNLGALYHDETAISYLQQSLSIGREIGNHQVIGWSLQLLADESITDPATATPYLDQCLSVSKASGDTLLMNAALNLRGWMEFHQENWDAASQMFNEGLSISRDVGNASGIADAVYCRGRVSYERGEYNEARRLFEESLSLARPLGNTYLIESSLDYLVRVARAQADRAAADRNADERAPLVRELDCEDELAQMLPLTRDQVSSRGDLSVLHHEGK